MADPQEHYQMVLDDLMARRAKLDAAISAIQEAMGMPATAQASNGGSSGTSTVRSDSFFGMTVLEATKKFLAMSKRTKTITEITDALKEGGYTFATGNPLGTVSAVLHRTDAKGGEVIRVSKGVYGLAEWYPGRGKRKSTDKNGLQINPAPELKNDDALNAGATEGEEK